MVAERELIQQYFTWDCPRDDVVIGSGDDAAVLDYNESVVATTDTLVANTHFYPDTDPYFLGRKSLAVNLSDLAAMGATPTHCLLALTLPNIEDAWLSQFAKGFQEIAQEYTVALVGGDLSKGLELSITVTALGASASKPLRQTTAALGDDVWVSGSIGGAHHELISGSTANATSKLHNPTPRVELGQQLSAVANAAVDLSDGLGAGCMLLGQASQKHIFIEGKLIPLVDHYKQQFSLETVKEAICGGEDYELLFTAPAEQREHIAQLATEQVPLTRIGEVKAGCGAELNWACKAQDLSTWVADSYQHFATKQTSTANLVAQLNERFTQSGATVVTAESCTAGLLAAALTSQAGASAWYVGSILAYSVEAKVAQLGIEANYIAEHGVVSEQVATQLATAALRKFGATFAVGITGWADASTTAQAPGTVCIAVVSARRVLAKTFTLAGNRTQVRELAVAQALQLLAELSG